MRRLPIFKRKDRPWDRRYYIRVPRDDGSGRYRVLVASESYKESKERLAKLKGRAVEGLEFPSRAAGRRRFSELVSKYWELHGKKLRSHTWAFYRKEIEKVFGNKRLAEITTEAIQRFYNELRDRHSVSHANKHFTLIRSIFSKAKRWKLFYGENPCAGVDVEREDNRRERVLSFEERGRLLSCSHPRLYPVIVFTLRMAMRKGEVLGITWENVDLDGNALYVLKTKSGKRKVLRFGPDTKALLMDQEPDEKKRTGKVFRLPEISLRRYFKKALQTASISDFKFHDLRHCTASIAVERTKDMPAVKEVLGHSTMSQTERYKHFSPDYMIAVMTALESAIPYVPVSDQRLPQA